MCKTIYTTVVTYCLVTCKILYELQEAKLYVIACDILHFLKAPFRQQDLYCACLLSTLCIVYILDMQSRRRGSHNKSDKNIHEFSKF